MLQLKVEAIKRELPDAATFYFSELSGKRIHYKPGQFITLVFDHHQEEIRRSYSISSSPDEDFLSITVKRVANGEISRFLLARIKTGDTLTAVEPAGRFTVDDSLNERVIFFFAAGSGIVPVFSQLKYLLKHKSGGKLVLVYSNQSERTTLFKDELASLALNDPGRFEIINFYSDNADRLNNLQVELLVNKQLKASVSPPLFYLCGPFTYMRMVKLTLLYMGFDARQIRKENFVTETVPVAQQRMDVPPRRITIHLKNERYNIIVGENQSILQAALQNNIPLPYSCRVGDCSTCAAICKAGKVTMAKNDVLTDADLEAGWILTCTGYPLTDDVVIEYE